MSESLDQIAVGARLFRVGGALSALVVVKATFALADRAVATLTTPLAITNTDRFLKDDPRRSLAAASDLAPALASPEVTFVGSAHAASAVPSRAVRLLLSRGQRVLVDKTLHVYGDRTMARGATAPSAPAPFTSMALVYERAYGGPSFHDNPCGTGASTGLSGDTRLPNVVYPTAMQQTLPAGFGPIGAASSSRRRLLPAGAEAGFRGAVLELDEPMHTAYFNAAPADQRAAALAGDERITLTGLVAGAEVFDTRLPGGAARASARLANGAESVIELAPDTIQIDGEARVASVLYRGSFPIADAAQLVGLRVVGWLTLPDGAEHARAAPSLPTSVPAPRKIAHAQQTVALGGVGSATVAELLAGGKATLPLGHEVPPSAPPLPFPESQRKREAAPASGPIPGAPWAPSAEPASFKPASGAQRTMIDAGAVEAPAPPSVETSAAPEQPAASIAVPVPQPASAAKPGGPIWREPLPEEVARPAPPAPRVAAARKDVNNLLYGNAPKKR